MADTKLAVVALLLAVVALAASLLAHLRQPRAAPPSRGGDHPGHLAIEQRLAALEARFEEVEADVDAVRLQPVPAVVESRRPTTDDPEDDGELEKRIAAMERELDSIGAQRRAFRERAAEKDRDEDERERRLIEESILRANDPASTAEEMLVALRSLRGRRLADGSDARLPVLPALIELGETAEDGDVRADVWRQLDGVDDPSLLTPLLHALHNDPHPRAREEAAESLNAFASDPNVVSALRYAVANDQDPGVVRQARDSIR